MTPEARKARVGVETGPSASDEAKFVPAKAYVDCGTGVVARYIAERWQLGGG
jgi:hypothetical protein